MYLGAPSTRHSDSRAESTEPRPPPSTYRRRRAEALRHELFDAADDLRRVPKRAESAPRGRHEVRCCAKAGRRRRGVGHSQHRTHATPPTGGTHLSPLRLGLLRGLEPLQQLVDARPHQPRTAVQTEVRGLLNAGRRSHRGRQRRRTVERVWRRRGDRRRRVLVAYYRGGSPPNSARLHLFTTTTCCSVVASCYSSPPRAFECKAVGFSQSVWQMFGSHTSAGRR